MKYSLIEIRDYVLKLAEVISEVLRVDVEIVDTDFIRIAGTGRYKNKACISIEGQNNVYIKVIESGKKQVIENPGFHKLCFDCTKKNSCIEKFEYCTPIIADGEVIGVIALICFTEEQKKIIIEKFKEYLDFLDKISDLISAKAEENYYHLAKISHVSNKADGIDSKSGFSSIIGRSPDIEAVKINAKKIAKGNAAVLISGESGTGKELFAKAIHYESMRSSGPFIAINCAAIPDNLLESELFGYATGAFTGANRNGKIGKFELASGGTIFLDEIGDMPLHFQVKLLRVLQEKAVIPVGSNKLKHVDVRIISATNKNLEYMVKCGEFREDLYYRLNVIPIDIPPLRERKQDIPILLNYFIKKYCTNCGVKIPEISKEAMEILKNYTWKGNVRELQNTVEYTLSLLEEGEIIDIRHLPSKIVQNTEKSYDESNHELKDEEFNLHKIEKETIEKALLKFGSGTENKKAAAKALGISLSTFYRKLEQYKIVNNE